MTTRTTNVLLVIAVALSGTSLVLQFGGIRSVQASTPVQVQDVVRAKLIELVAPDGKVVGQLHTAEDGSANLRLRSGSGEVRVKLGASNDGSGLVLLDSNTEPGVSLYAKGGGNTATVAEGGKVKRVVVQ